MAHITLPEDAPGIAGPMQAYPQTAVHLRGLANALLRDTVSLTPGERETIAAFVSSGNKCVFCTKSHAAAARHHLGEEHREIVEAALSGENCEMLSPKLRALLSVAEKVRRDGKEVTADDIAAARQSGADEKAIHDTVLIAAAFSMYNRYVEGLATWTPDDDALYDQMGARLAKNGYQAATEAAAG